MNHDTCDICNQPIATPPAERGLCDPCAVQHFRGLSISLHRLYAAATAENQTLRERLCIEDSDPTETMPL